MVPVPSPRWRPPGDPPNSHPPWPSRHLHRALRRRAVKPSSSRLTDRSQSAPSRTLQFSEPPPPSLTSVVLPRSPLTAMSLVSLLRAGGGPSPWPPPSVLSRGLLMPPGRTLLPISLSWSRTSFPRAGPRRVGGKDLLREGAFRPRVSGPVRAGWSGPPICTRETAWPVV